MPLAQVEQLANAYVALAGKEQVYYAAADTLKRHAQDANRLGVTPSELLQMKADAAAAHGGVYQQTYQQEQNRLRALDFAVQDVQDQAGVIAGIDSEVSGLQVVAGQNVKVQAAIHDLTASVATANMNAANAAREGKDKEAEAADKERKFLEARRKAQEPVSAPLALPGEHRRTK